VVTLGTGVTVANHEFSQNGSGFKTYGAALVGNQVWLGGEQHYLQVRNADSYAFQGCFLTGYQNVNPSNCVAQRYFGGAGGGGDYQVVEAIDGFVLGGCHCRGNHFNSFTDQEINLADRGLRIYRTDGTESSFFPGTIYWNEGPYGAMGDSNGCLYVGGDLTGNVDGFARFCEPVTYPRALSAQQNGAAVALSWQRPAVIGSGVALYEVLRNGSVIGQPTTTSFSDTTAVAGQTYTYTVRAVGTGGFTSQPSAAVTFTAAAGDTTPPSVPQNVTATVNVAAPSVTLNWSASTDNVAVRGYLVHRDFQFRAFVPAGTTFTDTTVTVGATYRYQVRAQDTSNNNSAPSTTLNVTVSTNQGPDTTPPSTPQNVTATVNAGAPSVTLNWTASTDNVRVKGYLVHREFQFLAFVPAGTTFTDTTVVAGATYRYQVRAQDASNNNSPPSPALSVTVV
jgi:chitodextrinase